jgi:hypothetical protein
MISYSDVAAKANQRVVGGPHSIQSMDLLDIFIEFNSLDLFVFD